MAQFRLGYVVFIFAAVCFLSVAGCDRTQETPTIKKQDFVEVATTVLEERTWERSFSAFGKIVPANEYEISVDVSAIVKKVLFDEGQVIKVGDTLLLLDDTKLRLKVESAEAGVAEAKANLNQIKTLHDRNRSVFKKGAISEQAYLKSEADLKAASANVQRAIATRSIAKQELSDTKVASPVSGVVKRRSIEPGKNVSPASSLGLIRAEDLLRVETFVSQKDINALRAGLACEIYAAGASANSYAGSIESIAGAAEDATGNFRVRVSVANVDGSLRDGMAAKVTFTGISQDGVISIPRSAVVDRNRKLIAFRVKDSLAEAVEPVLGIGNSSHYPVISGLNSGDELITSNLRLVTSGQRIQPQSR